MTDLEQAEEAAAKALFLSWQEPQDENEVRRWTQVWDNNKERDPREYDPSVIFALKAADAAMSAAQPILALALIEKHRALEEALAALEEAGQIMGALVDDHNDPQWADIVNACEGIRVFLARQGATA